MFNRRTQSQWLAPLPRPMESICNSTLPDKAGNGVDGCGRKDYIPPIRASGKFTLTAYAPMNPNSCEHWHRASVLGMHRVKRTFNRTVNLLANATAMQVRMDALME